MTVIRSENKSLNILARYNRKVGLPSILVASIVASVVLGLYAYMGVPIYGATLGLIVSLLLAFMFLDTLLMLANFLSMNFFFDRVLKEYCRKGLPYASLVGIEAIKDASKKETEYASILCASSTSSLVMYLFGNVSPEIIFTYLSMGSALITFGFSIIKREHVLDPDEMLRLYEPDVFPSVITTDVFLETFIHPFNRLRFQEYEEEISEYLKEELTTGDALSKLSLLLYQNLYGVIATEDVRKEVSELLKRKEYVTRLELHHTFGFDRLKVILGKAKRLVPELTQLLDRLFVKMLDDFAELKGSSVFIDAEVSLKKKRGQIGKGFVLLYNNLSDKNRALSISYTCGSVFPTTAEVAVTLSPRDFDLPFEDVLPVYSGTGQDVAESETEHDVVGLMSRFMDNIRIVWFSFEIRENGVKPILVTVKDRDTGQTLFGETFLLEASYDLPGLVLKALGSISLFFGVLLPFARILKLPI